MKNILFLIIIFFSITTAWGQQDPMFTKYMFNSLVFNPAYAGSRDVWDINATYRKQWQAFDGAPRTILLGADGTLKDDRVGIGFTLFNDQIGVTRQTDFSANYAYRIPTNSGRLSIGIKAGAAFIKADFSDLIVQAGDPLYASSASSTTPYVGTGIFYKTENRDGNNFYFGLSSPSIFSFDTNKKDSIPNFLKRHFYGQLGAGFPIGNSGIELKPSIMVSYQNAAPIQAHLNFTALYRSLFAAGISYRTGDALNLNAVLFINKVTRIGLAYDITLSELKKYNNGSFEIMLGHQLTKDITKVDSGRNL